MSAECDVHAELSRKTESLEDALRGMGSALVAFSGGVDSTFLAAVAHAVLGAKALAVTAVSPAFPQRELAEARELAARIGVRQREIETREIEDDAYADNPPDRCYHCKTELFGILRRIAAEEKLAFVLDGTNADDAGDYRPGSLAARELGVRSPLQEAGFTKADIRAASRRMGLPTADKPAYACLASRFPYGSRITEQALHMVEQAEDALHDLGFRQVRVRHHGELARIELDPAEIPRAMADDVRGGIVDRLRECGFIHVTLDLQGYRTGSMNEAGNAPRSTFNSQRPPAADV